ncbi:MAG: UTP--glucose-1-phosphate uridylyltransferase, partial [Phycisphaerae bacterium]
MPQPRDRDARYERCHADLRRRNQQHVLAFWPELDPRQRAHLVHQIESIPWATIDPLIESHVRQAPRVELPDRLEPAPVWPAVPRNADTDTYRDARALGRDLIRAGKVAAFTVAGGQGTRLGYDGPKGVVPVTPVGERSLFSIFADTIRAVRDRHRVAIPWYIMTSPGNHDATVAYLERHAYFGLPAADVRLFSQAMLPAFDLAGRLILEAKDRIALAPDGHGGSLKALVASGALADMRDRGVDVISYFQVDNPLVKPFDPLFIGLHAATGSDMSTKVTPKAHDLEKVGNVCLADGKVTVIE